MNRSVYEKRPWLAKGAWSHRMKPEQHARHNPRSTDELIKEAYDRCK